MSHILTSSSKSHFNFKGYIDREFEGKFCVYLCSHAQEQQMLPHATRFPQCKKE
jgi:hypothetical protein